MTSEEIEAILKGVKWDLLGEGTYNKAYVTKDRLTIEGMKCHWVYKVCKGRNELSNSYRAIRKWNILNPTYPAYKTSSGWITPYLGNVPATDEQIALKLIEIYQRTRIIIIDAPSRNNFLLHNGEVICVDVDLALRRGSLASENFFVVDAPRVLPKFLEDCTRTKPKTVEVINALLWLDLCLAGKGMKINLTLPFLEKIAMLSRKKKKITLALVESLQELLAHVSPDKILDNFLITLLEADTVPYPAISGRLQAIHHAVELGLFNQVKALITLNPKLIRITNEQGLTPLDLAIQNGHIAIACILMDAGALCRNLHEALNGKRLEQLIREGNLEGVRLLLRHNPDLLNKKNQWGYAPLHDAVRYKQVAIFQFLLEIGADINVTVLSTAVSTVHAGMTALDMAHLVSTAIFFHALLEKNATCNKLYTAAKAGLLSRVHEIVKARPERIDEVDSLNQTALLWAAALGQDAMVAFLIAEGAALNIATKLPRDNKDYNAYHNATALDWARARGHAVIISRLEKAGAIANKRPPSRADDDVSMVLSLDSNSDIEMTSNDIANNSDHLTSDSPEALKGVLNGIRFFVSPPPRTISIAGEDDLRLTYVPSARSIIL